MRSGPGPGFVAGSQGAGATMTPNRHSHEVHRETHTPPKLGRDPRETIPLEARFHESPRSIAWNRLWYKMLSEVLEQQRRTRPPEV